MRIFHIVEPSEWAACGDEYTPSSFAQDGFVHFSFVHQVERVANALYRDRRELVVVEFDEADVKDLRVEDCYEAGEEFPHIYEPIRTGSARSVTAMARASDGSWTFSAGGASAPA